MGGKAAPVAPTPMTGQTNENGVQILYPMVSSIRSDFEAENRDDREEWDIHNPLLNLNKIGKRTAIKLSL
jgi:hypothetical protein